MLLCLGQAHVNSIHAFLALFQLESDRIVLTDFVDQTSDMDEVLLIGFIVANESITLGLIEELYCTFFHENVEIGNCGEDKSIFNQFYKPLKLNMMRFILQ